jgi:DedD protein
MERKKLVTTVTIVGLALLALIVASIVWLRPWNKAEQGDAVSLNLRATPKNSGAAASVSSEATPAESLSPSASPVSGGGGDIIVIYGQQPSDQGQASAAPVSDTSVLNAPSATSAPLADNAGTADNGQASASSASSKVAQKTGAATSSSSTKNAKASAAASGAKSSAKPVRVSEYWIQVASFKSRGKADDLRDNLKKQGIQALITTKEIDGTSYYRVRVGSFSSDAEAQSWVAKIRKQEGCAQAYVSKTIALKAVAK